MRSGAANGVVRKTAGVYRHSYPQGGGYATADYHTKEAAERGQKRLGGTVTYINAATGKAM
ncbi:hypothetical protein DY218_27205 [Streptomyces triticagri]|uniref:Uncharacterized protein n=1 Tax=Streptomyces triticagri TaxID=2293568 RepID=A0A372LY38_9ACTN|nr:hypothetical protein [Streptomyces triticagri]RFU83598.1 hypothetical protein DY218_27205 [Streptomyces triticagri]